MRNDTRMHSSGMRTAHFIGRLSCTHSPALPCTPPPHMPSSPCMPPFAIHTPPVTRITDRSKNITFPQLQLRAVINFEDPLVVPEHLCHLWGGGHEPASGSFNPPFNFEPQLVEWMSTWLPLTYQ